MVGMIGSSSKRRMGVVVNNALLFLSLIISIEGFWVGWTPVTWVIFWISVALVITTFFPVHVRTGLWRMVHAKADELDERELLQTLHTLRYAYAVFAIVTLAIVLTLIISGLGDQVLKLVIFWVLLYLAHTLPSSILGWKLTRVPGQVEE